MRDAEVLDDAVDELHQLEQRLGDEVEPAPVDHAVEVLNAECLFIAVDQRCLLGACIKMAFDTLARVRRDDERAAQIVGLEGVNFSRVASLGRARIRGVVGLFLIRNQRCGPILVGDAEPAAGDVFVFFFGFGFDRVGVRDFLQAFFAGHADQAFVQNVVWRPRFGVPTRMTRA